MIDLVEAKALAELAAAHALAHHEACRLCQRATIERGPTAHLCDWGEAFRTAWNAADDEYFELRRLSSFSNRAPVPSRELVWLLP